MKDLHADENLDIKYPGAALRRSDRDETKQAIGRKEARARRIERDRVTLVRNINRAFGPKQISVTAKQLSKLPSESDFLDISKALGFLDTLDRGNFAQYRKNLPFPKLIQSILTTTYRTALFGMPPTPMRIRINTGPSYAVEITAKPSLISVVLTRPLYGK